MKKWRISNFKKALFIVKFAYFFSLSCLQFQPYAILFDDIIVNVIL